jgi:MTH538 TIR-like domain (DUF1863)
MTLKLVAPEDQVPPSAPDVPRYWAFLSYSHHDKAVAKRLQKQLETYRVPRRLVGRETSHGPVPARVSPVFRDRDELHAGADLKASVQDALSKSRWLIVVCTPDAARSPWVNREIIEFKKLHGERRVLALIARGEPFASDMPGREAEECFPPALRRALNDQGVPEGELLEPIAADMRKHGDGPQRATLKLLAGMLGVSFDDLVRRDMQRRVRLLSVVAGASVLGLVAFAFLAVMAVQARNEAQYQRVQAEGLIEFMLGDLRKKLEPVGRLEVLDSVGEKALAYYGAQDAEGLDATALGHRSRAMHLIGEIRDLRGQQAEALIAFEQAAATTAQLLAKAPNDPQRIYDHAQSVFWVGDAAWKRADGAMAEDKFGRYLDLAGRLSQIDPTNSEWRAELAFAHVNVATVQLGTNRPAQALKSLAIAVEILNDIRLTRPGLGFELAQAYGWQADAYAMLGDYPSALAREVLKQTVFLSMPGADKNKRAQRGIVSSLFKASRYELALGRTDLARIRARDSLSIAVRLVEADPQNQFWRGDECATRLALVEIESTSDERALAREELKASSDCLAKFGAKASFNQYGSLLLRARALWLAAALVEGPPVHALALEMQQFLRQALSMLGADNRDRAKLTLELANVAIALGELQSRSSPNAAHDSWRQAEALLKPFVELRDGAVLTLMARTRMHLGDLPAARAFLEQVRDTSYRHPAYADLTRQLQFSGGNPPPSLTSGAKP